MRLALRFFFLFLASGSLHAADLDGCEARLNPKEIREIVLRQLASHWSLARLEGTALEVSAVLRVWKQELASKLRLEPEEISGTYRPGAGNAEEISRSGEVSVLMVRSRAGLRSVIALEIDLTRERLVYLDPAHPRIRLSSIFRISDGGRPSFNIPAFADSFERAGTTGNVVGVLKLKIPGFNP